MIIVSKKAWTKKDWFFCEKPSVKCVLNLSFDTYNYIVLILNLWLQIYRHFEDFSTNSFTKWSAVVVVHENGWYKLSVTACLSNWLVLHRFKFPLGFFSCYYLLYAHCKQFFEKFKKEVRHCIEFLAKRLFLWEKW